MRQSPPPPFLFLSHSLRPALPRLSCVNVLGGNLLPPSLSRSIFFSSVLLLQGPNPLASKKKTLKKSGRGGSKQGGGAKRGTGVGVAAAADGGEGKTKRRRRRKMEGEGQGKSERKDAE